MAEDNVKFFTDINSVNAQTEGQAYGVKSNSTFQLTSCFSVSEGCKVYAITKCFVIVVRQDIGNPSGLVNLILKPQEANTLDVPVKYFIIRGVKCESFFSSNGEIKTDTASDSSGFIKRLWQIQRNRLGDGATTKIDTTTLTYGTDSSAVSDDLRIDELFVMQGNNTDSQPCPVESGVDLGVFGSSAGIDIVLEGEYSPKLSEVRLPAHTITLEPGNTEDDAATRFRKETVLHYMDASAFYSMHSVDNSKFFTKDRLYIDIRDRFDNSYNYNSGQNKRQIKVNGVNAMPYETSGWPVHACASTGTSVTIAIGTASDRPCTLFIRQAEAVTYGGFQIQPTNDIFCVRCAVQDLSDGYTPAIQITTKTVNSSVIIHVLPEDTNSALNLLSYSFEPMTVRTSAKLREWSISDYMKYIASGNRIMSAEAGFVRDRVKSATGTDTDMYLYYVRPTAYFEPSDSIVRNDFYPNARNDNDIRYSCAFEQFNSSYSSKIVSGEQVQGMRSFKYKSKCDDIVYFVCITADEQNEFSELARTFSSYHRVTFALKHIENIDQTGIQTYELVLTGYGADGTFVEKSCGSNGIRLYSTDGFIFTSETFLSGYPTIKNISYSVRFDLPSDYKPCFGFDWMRDSYRDTIVGAYTDNCYVGNNGEAYKLLEKEYLPASSTNDNLMSFHEKFMKLFNSGYYIPWLTLHTGDEAILCLQVDAEDVDIKKIRKETITFSIPVSLSVKLDGCGSIENGHVCNIKNLRNKRIKIRKVCDTTDDDMLWLTNGDGGVVGALNIYKTHPMKQLNLHFISVSFRGTLTCQDGTIIKMTDPEDSNVKYGEYNYERWIRWAKKGNIEIAKKYMTQANIKLTDSVNLSSKRNNVDFTYNFFDKHLIFNVSKGTVTCHEKNGTQIGIVKNNPFTRTLCQNILREVTTTEGKALVCKTEQLFDALAYSADERKHINPAEIYVYLCPIKFMDVADGEERDESGFYLRREFIEEGTKVRHIEGIVLCGNPDYIKNKVLAHEVSHQQSLEHSFLDNDDSDRKKKFVFLPKKTDNIMDYNDAEYNYFWKWQIDQIRNEYD